MTVKEAPPIRDEVLKKTLAGTFLVCFLLLHFHIKHRMKPSFEGAGIKAGQTAIPFEAMTLTHTKTQLSSLVKTHKLTVLNFWESWCGPCKMELPELQNLYSMYKDRGLEIVGVYGNSSDESAQQIAHDYSLTYTLIHDDAGTIAKSYGVEAVPTTFVIDSNLKILRSQEGIDAGLKTFIQENLSAEGKGT